MAPPVPVPAIPSARPYLDPLHDFAAKLRQPALHPRLAEYVGWRRAVLAAREAGAPEPDMPSWAPLSINLDLTTACNYACDHCIDWDLLNSGISHDERRLRESLERMAAAGLKSVILIGGGEPTIHPRFGAFVRHLKALRLQVAVVTNGSRNDRILVVADAFGAGDWVRLSLDAGTDATFQAMHRPKRPITLEEICAGIRPVKERNPALRVGFSFVIVWAGSERGDVAVHENVDEIPLAARLARDSGFDYVSFKPFLARTAEGAEAVGAPHASFPETIARIRRRLDEAKATASESFAVLESTNLRALESGTTEALARQPRTCHMQALRQVLTPTGLWNCPAHRGAEKARIAGPAAYAGDDEARDTARSVASILDRFDASHECREVACLYNGANWWIESAVAGSEPVEGPGAEREDWFL
jgi:molybdenum cofactor biosynthesis enzyme MoaA